MPAITPSQFQVQVGNFEKNEKYKPHQIKNECLYFEEIERVKKLHSKNK